MTTNEKFVAFLFGVAAVVGFGWVLKTVNEPMPVPKPRERKRPGVKRQKQ